MLDWLRELITKIRSRLFSEIPLETSYERRYFMWITEIILFPLLIINIYHNPWKYYPPDIDKPRQKLGKEGTSIAFTLPILIATTAYGVGNTIYLISLKDKFPEC